MNKRRYISCFIIMLGLSLARQAFAQLSPGPLTTAHADLEGISNCTQCHDIGQRVPDSKCLECHKEIQSLLSRKRGYHASREVRTSECIDCHSEHHGRKFEMVRFDTEAFDHALTGYSLEGQHALIDCRECHSTENIVSSELKTRENTWLGLEHECVACHTDYHQNTLGTDCASCHDFDAFRPASGFDHDNTDYALTGMHLEVECLACHPMQTRNNKEFQLFNGISFGDCVSCHDDPHGNLPGTCSACHTVSGFDQFRGQKTFRHSLTRFELKGKHKSVSCFDCHNSALAVSQIFQDRGGVEEQACIQCHDDVHDGKFGTDCASCHNENSFLELNANMDFDHSLTDFELEGLHVGVECTSCHTGTSFTEPIDFNYCRNCHEDYHEGEFVQADGMITDCSECHSVMQEFSFTSFGFAEHQETGFPLEGAHIATPCFACHLSEEDWSFRDIGHQCIDCHDDIHDGYISESYYPDKNCTACHNTEIWSDVQFDHSLTDWNLEDRHAETDCRSCHFVENDAGYTQSFSKLESSCYNCHENIHGEQFEENGITDCARCHNTAGWTGENFDHSRTEFPLEGKHAELDCNVCHKKEIDNIRVFKIEKFACIDCHS